MKLIKYSPLNKERIIHLIPKDLSQFQFINSKFLMCIYMLGPNWYNSRQTIPIKRLLKPISGYQLGHDTVNQMIQSLAKRYGKNKKKIKLVHI